MKRPKQNNLKKGPVTNRLPNANGKIVVAVVLVAVMALLWGRVLLKGENAPTAAVAESVQQIQEAAVQPGQTFEVVPVQLDVIPRRHDMLAGDMFSTEHWDAFGVENNGVNVTASENTLAQKHQAGLRKIAAALKLEAIIRDADGKPVRVFVNDAVLTVGSVLTVKEGPDQYELLLKGINENEATFLWDETSITLKMTETVEK